MKKIIFDLDNTLLFIPNDGVNAYKNIIEKYDINITSEELYKGIGTFEKNMKNILVTEDIFCDYLKEKFSIDITKEILYQLLDAYSNIPLVNTEVIYDVLDYLSKKYELIFYSNWFTQNQIDRLKNYNLDKFFTKVYGWDRLPTKPSLEGLKTIVNNDDVKDFIVIGDSIEIDMEVPDSMGIKTILYNEKQIKQDKYQEINDIRELKDVL